VTTIIAKADEIAENSGVKHFAVRGGGPELLSQSRRKTFAGKKPRDGGIRFLHLGCAGALTQSILRACASTL